MSVPLATDRPLLAAMWADLANIQARFVEQQALFAPHYTTMHIIAERIQNLNMQCVALAMVDKNYKGHSADGDRRLDTAEEKLLSDMAAFKTQLTTFYAVAGVV